MRKILVAVVASLAVMGLSSLVLAEENKGDMNSGKEMAQAGMACNQEMTGKARMMGMKHMMTNKSMVATSDGGVVVMVGDKLYKYDKNLELKKEVEIKMDLEGMCKKMKDMRGKCPMMLEKMKDEGKVK